MKNRQITFTVTLEAAAYLRWLADNVLFEKSESLAAKHLMMDGLTRSRRKNMAEEPGVDHLVRDYVSRKADSDDPESE
ncbi:hypothetical protein [Rhodophyticola porphyridii]|uniref:hypothetical protein n=1 Tax=Rhodophyticola porphyridii TaxID=1852017 RepID=UPI0035CF5283